MADKPKESKAEKDAAEAAAKNADAAKKAEEAAKTNPKTPEVKPPAEVIEKRVSAIKLRTAENMHGDRTGIGSALHFISGLPTHQNSSKAPAMPELHPHKKHDEPKTDAHAKKPAAKADDAHGADHGRH